MSSLDEIVLDCIGLKSNERIHHSTPQGLQQEPQGLHMCMFFFPLSFILSSSFLFLLGLDLGLDLSLERHSSYLTHSAIIALFLYVVSLKAALAHALPSACKDNGVESS